MLLVLFFVREFRLDDEAAGYGDCGHRGLGQGVSEQGKELGWEVGLELQVEGERVMVLEDGEVEMAMSERLRLSAIFSEIGRCLR